MSQNQNGNLNPFFKPKLFLLNRLPGLRLLCLGEPLLVLKEPLRREHLQLEVGVGRLGAPAEGVAHGEDAEAAEGVQHRHDEQEQRHEAARRRRGCAGRIRTGNAAEFTNLRKQITEK